MALTSFQNAVQNNSLETKFLKRGNILAPIAAMLLTR